MLLKFTPGEGVLYVTSPWLYVSTKNRTGSLCSCLEWIVVIYNRSWNSQGLHNLPSNLGVLVLDLTDSPYSLVIRSQIPFVVIFSAGVFWFVEGNSPPFSLLGFPVSGSFGVLRCVLFRECISWFWIINTTELAQRIFAARLKDVYASPN